jgi:Rod binding domain-containing protein
MSAPSVSAIGAAPVDPREAALRKSAADLQGLFVQQLYKSMRSSVDADGGLVEKSQGEDIFAGLMDERLAADTGTRWHRGLGDAIYRALRQKAGLDSATSPTVGHPAPSDAPLASPARIP